MTWTEEHIEQLTVLLADGLSCREIAAAIGGITRNAVIGKIGRLGLKRPAKNPTVKRERKAKPAKLTTPLSLPQGTEACDLPDEDIPIEQRKTLLELTRATCRWPCGDPGTVEFYFCGAATKAGSSYCPRHHAFTHTKVRAPIVVIPPPRSARV